jgi:hypothetical protein
VADRGRTRPTRRRSQLCERVFRVAGRTHDVDRGFPSSNRRRLPRNISSSSTMNRRMTSVGPSRFRLSASAGSSPVRPAIRLLAPRYIGEPRNQSLRFDFQPARTSSFEGSHRGRQNSNPRALLPSACPHWRSEDVPWVSRVCPGISAPCPCSVGPDRFTCRPLDHSGPRSAGVGRRASPHPASGSLDGGGRKVLGDSELRVVAALDQIDQRPTASGSYVGP